MTASCMRSSSPIVLLFPQAADRGCLPPPQETIGEVTQLHVENIDVHPYHHHTQPYQIVALDNDTSALDGTWRVPLPHRLGMPVANILLPCSKTRSNQGCRSHHAPPLSVHGCMYRCPP